MVRDVDVAVLSSAGMEPVLDCSLLSSDEMVRGLDGAALLSAGFEL